MGSSQQDRSLGEGTFLPSWMKGRMDNRFDFTDSTFSPPSADDSFFYIRYPKSSSKDNNSSSSGNNATTANDSGFKSFTEAFGSRSSSAINNNNTKTISATDQIVKDSKTVDFSKHPLACQTFMQQPAAEKASEPKIILANRPKPNFQAAATEFRNDEGSADCGKSIVSVANQMMSAKLNKSVSADTASHQQQQQQEGLFQKVSKSLPATPIASPNNTPDSSPRSRRRVYNNRFFTGAFVPDPRQNGWLLGGILGQSREIVNTKIEEEDEQNNEPIPPRTLNRKKSISSQNLTYLGDEEHSSVSQTTAASVGTSGNVANKIVPKKSIRAQFAALQANPSELREMNFWTPTSM